ncbi:N,N-dimethylformamidase beta subunit family domain-containing protein [Streptomyces sp. NPDC058746]|uniref:N,N-dimethylformamidase beta subunit family domain-containing protein n=1 Tax=Streptomyces sp. NPDC058746 TaxID=3346622 RepID=UPI0036C216EF
MGRTEDSGPAAPRHREGPARRRVLGLAAGLVASAPLPAAAAPAHLPSAAGQGPAAVAPAAAPSGLDVASENRRPGDPDWRITRAGRARAIEGFAEAASVLPGEPLGLRVSTTAPSYTVSAYRMGWYGGARARLVWRSPALPGVLQPARQVDPATRTARAEWRRTAEADTTGWPEGNYLLRLDTVGGERAQRYVPVTVRSASAAGRMVFANAVGTWQAYNRWGGADLYQGATGKRGSRSLAVTFDRPYSNARGAGQFLTYEAPLLALAERIGAPLAYATGIDVARDPALLRGAAALLSPGHDEYWSPEQRRNVTAARDEGMNLAVFGANCCYRRVRFQETAVGADRTLVCYKDDYAADPGFRRGLPPTNDYRGRPSPDPESSLLGVIYSGYPVDAPLVVTRPGHWLLAGTGAGAGESFPHLVGVEYDRIDLRYPTPRPVEILAHSPVVLKGRHTYADAVYASLPSGAGLFATGTMRWVEALEAGTAGVKVKHGLDARTGRFTRTVTENVLRAFAAGPAGRARPARDDVSLHYRPDGAPTGPASGV